MRDLLDDLDRWRREGVGVAIARVVDLDGSGPRLPGAAMAVNERGEVVGSVSGGCVEGAVYELGQDVVESGRPVLQRYGVSDDDAYAVGLTCGGILDVFVEKVSIQTFPELGDVAADIEAGRPVALATVIEHPEPTWVGRRLVIHPEQDDDDDVATEVLGSRRVDDAVRDDARGMLEVAPAAGAVTWPLSVRAVRGCRCGTCRPTRAG